MLWIKHFSMSQKEDSLIMLHNAFQKVKQYHYRPGQALGVPEGWSSQISRQSAHKGGKVVSPMHQPLYPPRKYSWYSFLLEAESTPGSQGGQKDCVNEKIPMTPSGIEPATFRLVVHCLNRLYHHVPHIPEGGACKLPFKCDLSHAVCLP